MLVDDRHVQRVGTGDPPDADRVVDLPGATIVPGFVDTHVHLTGTGVPHQAPELGSATSREELLGIVRRVVEGRDGPVLVHGFDESRWVERRLPSIADLDAIGDRPVAIVRVDGHVTFANRAALSSSGAWSARAWNAAMTASRRAGSREEANAALRRWFSSHLAERDVEELQLAAASLAVSHGVTTVHEMSMPHERGLRDLEILRHRARLPLDVLTYVATMDIPQVMDLGLAGDRRRSPRRWVDRREDGRGVLALRGWERVGRPVLRRRTRVTSSTTRTWRASRWGCMRSGMPRSSR